MIDDAMPLMYHTCQSVVTESDGNNEYVCTLGWRHRRRRGRNPRRHAQLKSSEPVGFRSERSQRPCRQSIGRVAPDYAGLRQGSGSTRAPLCQLRPNPGLGRHERAISARRRQHSRRFGQHRRSSLFSFRSLNATPSATRRPKRLFTSCGIQFAGIMRCGRPISGQTDAIRTENDVPKCTSLCRRSSCLRSMAGAELRPDGLDAYSCSRLRRPAPSFRGIGKLQGVPSEGTR